MGAAAGMQMWGQGVKTMMTFDAAKEEKNVGAASEKEIQQQIYVEEKLAAQQEIERRRNLMRALASQNAARGAQGIGGLGSSSNASLTGVKDYETDKAVHNFNATMRKAALTQKGRNIRRAADIKANNMKTGAIVDLFSMGGQAMANS